MNRCERVPGTVYVYSFLVHTHIRYHKPETCKYVHLCSFSVCVCVKLFYRLMLRLRAHQWGECVRPTWLTDRNSNASRWQARHGYKITKVSRQVSPGLVSGGVFFIFVVAFLMQKVRAKPLWHHLHQGSCSGKVIKKSSKCFHWLITGTPQKTFNRCG